MSMELGLGFDDEDIVNEERPKALISKARVFSAKIAEPMWFVNASSADPLEQAEIHKFRGDHYYLLRQYQAALQEYERQLDLLAEGNSVGRWDALESVCRCHLALSCPEKGVEAARMLAKLAKNADHKCIALQNMALASKCAGNTADLIATLHKLVSLHPQNISFWMQLGNAYAMRHADGHRHSAQLTDLHTISECTAMAALCYIRCKILLDDPGNRGPHLFGNDLCSATKVDELLAGIGLQLTKIGDICRAMRSTTTEREAELSEIEKITVADMDATEMRLQFERQWLPVRSLLEKTLHTNQPSLPPCQSTAM